MPTRSAAAIETCTQLQRGVISTCIAVSRWNRTHWWLRANCPQQPARPRAAISAEAYVGGTARCSAFMGWLSRKLHLPVDTRQRMRGRSRMPLPALSYHFHDAHLDDVTLGPRNEVTLILDLDDPRQKQQRIHLRFGGITNFSEVRLF